MKTLRILSVLIVAALMFSCEKDIEKSQLKQDVEFGITQIDPNLLKSDPADFDIMCDPTLNPPSYAEIKVEYIIDGNVVKETLTPEVFLVGGKMYTKSIKLEPNTYKVLEFLLKDENDQIIMAVPADDSDYAVYVPRTVPFEFVVTEFEKLQEDVGVLCYEEESYLDFGFNWFYIDRIVVRNFCFFGDICVKDASAFANSIYADQVGFPESGTGYFDASAIIKMDVKSNGSHVPGSPFKNYETLGEGSPLCVKFPNHLDHNQIFTFEMSIWLPVGDGFEYVKSYTFTALNDGPLLDEDGNELLDIDNDDIFDFVLGECNYSDTDLVLPPYQNLPTTANVSIVIDVNNPFANGAYWALTVNSLDPAGSYDFPPASDDDIYLGWCGSNVNINQGAGTFYIYSSLNDANWPAGLNIHVSVESLAKVNWLFNNLPPQYPSLDEMFIYEDDWNAVDPDDAKALQHAIWKLLGINSLASNVVGGSDFPLPDAMTMVNYADTWAAQNGVFVPMPGGYAAVLMVKANDPTQHQLVFTMVDP